jgi:GTPase SAR1 family protein
MECSPQPDPILQKKWGLGGAHQRIIPKADKTFQEQLSCGNCRRPSRQRVCSHCHMKLPRLIVTEPTYTLAVIGAKNTGKSVYISALVEQLKGHVGKNVGVNINEADENTTTRYQEDFYQPLYKQRRKLKLTTTATTEKKNSLPLVFVIRPGADLGLGRGLKKPISLSFFDTAGEDLNDSDTIASVNKYIFNADGIILLLDPLQIEAVRRKLESTDLPDIETSPDIIVTRVANLIERSKDLGDRKIDIPLAVALTKFDAVEHLFPEHAAARANPIHKDGFDKDDFSDLTQEIKQQLDKWDSERLARQVEARFTKTGFFAVSSTGCSADKQGNFAYVRSRRVADPFLWLLHEKGLLDEARS